MSPEAMSSDAHRERLAREVLGQRVIDPPSALSLGVPVALARDAHAELGAASLVTATPAGVVCHAIVFQRHGGDWVSAYEYDNTTSPDPLTRPAQPTNSTVEWMDWASSSGVYDFGPTTSHSMFGIAPVGTHRVTVQSAQDAERPVRISPASGAFVCVMRGSWSTVRGYDAAGTLLGSVRFP